MPLRAIDDWDSEQPILNSVLAAWAIQLTGHLNRTLPRESYRTYPDIISGLSLGEELPEHGGPTPTATGITVLEDVCEVHILEPAAQLRPVGVVVLVRPTTKADMPSSLLWTCLAYLRRGIPLVVIDVADVGEETVLDGLAPFLGVPELGTRLGVAGYRPVWREGEERIDTWTYPVSSGAVLPTVPLGLRGGPVVLLDLEATYTAAIEATGL